MGKFRNCTIRVNNIKISNEQVGVLTEAELKEVDALFNKYHSMFDTFNAALKGVSDD